MALSQYLKDEKIDQIEDDQEFCHKEYEAIGQRSGGFYSGNKQLTYKKG